MGTRNLNKMVQQVILLSALIKSFPAIAQKKGSISETKQSVTSLPKILGNSWYLSASYNISRSNEVDFTVGRTYGVNYMSSAIAPIETHSYGIGLGFTTQKNSNKQLAKAFYEYCFFSILPYSFGARAEYFYDIAGRAHYVRPALGFSLLHFDVFYNYSFNLSSKSNDFGHGINFRLKYFHKKKLWRKKYP